ncbi:hypothetical protein OG979_17480 [Actinomadura citrea]|uniref:hypothetical protein n=1 Tax=Actinomadura citrea TaxID=46158 RepID=UPI002E2AA85A|nr:hypothetical protein [Actinomadura citrea]
MDEQDNTASEPADGPADEPQDTPLGDAGSRALKAEREARKAAEKALRDANERISALEGADVRREIAEAKGLTPAQAKRLNGATREELESDADDLLAAFGRPADSITSMRPPKEDLQPGASRVDDSGDELAAMAERIIRR